MDNRKEVVALSSLIAKVYTHLNHTTPLSMDCGLLCNHHCCRGDEAGMWLLPGERELLAHEEGYRFLESEDETVLICAGHCRREFRPFACRVFPLFPLVSSRSEGGYSVRLIFDPRAHSLCPLAQSRYPLRGIFRYLARQATRELLKDPQICDWFLEHSAFLEALAEIQAHLTER